MRSTHDMNSPTYASQFNEPQSAPAEPFVSSLARRFETLRTILADTNGDLVSLSDRVLGPIPRGVEASTNGLAKASGQADDCLSSLDLLISFAASARDEAQRLNSRI